jgi:hypothetical protein
MQEIIGNKRRLFPTYFTSFNLVMVKNKSVQKSDFLPKLSGICNAAQNCKMLTKSENSDFLTPLLFLSDLQKLSYKLNCRKIG